MKNPNDTLRIQNYNFVACTAVPQPNASLCFAGNPYAIKY
jgi:hypothetical protein